MRLLILHLATAFGGAERTTGNLLSHLDRRRVSHLTLAAPGALRPYLPERYDAFIDTSPSIRDGWFATPARLYADVRACARLLEQAQPDVALGMMHYSAALVAMSVRLAGLPTRTVASYRGPAYEYLRRYERGWRRLAFLRLAIGSTARLADRMLVPSEGTARELRRRFWGSPARTRVVLNGIDGPAVQSAALENAPGLERLPADLPLICVAARLSPEKDLGLMFEAFRQLQARQAATLAVVGDGPERGALEAQIAAWGLAERVAFVGHRENVYPYMRRADAFVHTCQFEGFGYTMLEAMACGTPVIATDCPYGPREVLDDGRCGILVPCDDAGALATAMSHLLADENRRRALARLGLERAEQLSISAMVKGYESVFLELTRGR